ncbi:MAG: hypothetical protein EP326_06650 [Deltaproteobacteria bacterium]|jgi:hypothetical protein|nr:MAG: hypothetical protein EP326_06650 [Deltaproteobacteria bacterium]TNF31975.1 MAG: hypothetical protein EP319_00580 [Deltaproteobacteria bacterium]
MTLIRINSRNVEQKIDQKKSINSVMDFILQDLANEEEVVSNIHVNGQEISPDQDNIMNSPISDFESVDFTLTKSVDLAFDALDSSGAYIDIMIEKIQKLTVLYQQNQTAEANKLFGEAIEIIDLFIQLMTRVQRTFKKSGLVKGQKTETIAQLEIHLLSILKALIPAKEKEDIIMLCDLLEYELIDNLTQWKIRAVPELKKLRIQD